MEFRLGSGSEVTWREKKRGIVGEVFHLSF
jgi:hypothetical protein